MQPTAEEFVESALEDALERLTSGQPFVSNDAQLVMLRNHARKLIREFNETTEDRHHIRVRQLTSLFGALGEAPDVESPLFVEFGRHIFAGDGLSMGPGCVLIDVGRITLGHHVRLDAGVLLNAVSRPMGADHRARGYAQAAPIEIGDAAWIGARSVVGPGLTIGARTVVAPGSVVTEDLPAGVLAAGNPCRIVRNV